MKSNVVIKYGIGAAVLILSSMLSNTAFGAVIVIIALGVSVALHELGHWLFARLARIRVPVFSVGFGPADRASTIFTLWGTEFQLRPVPLGGFIEMDEESQAKSSFFGCAAMLIAGPAMNLIIALVLFFCLFISVGAPVMGEIQGTYVAQLSDTNTRAKTAGLRQGDDIVSVEGAAVVEPEKVSQALQQRHGQPTEIIIKRNGENLSISVVPDSDGMIGIGLGARTTYSWKEVGFFDATSLAFKATGAFVWRTLKLWSDLFQGDGLNQVQSVVGIVAFGSEAVNSGTVGAVIFIAVLNIGLAVLNLLPAPILDGGQLIFLMLEKLRGRPLARRTKACLGYAAMVVLLGLTCFALYNDFVRMFGDTMALPAVVVTVLVVASLFLPRSK